MGRKPLQDSEKKTSVIGYSVKRWVIDGLEKYAEENNISKHEAMETAIIEFLGKYKTYEPTTKPKQTK